MESTCFICNKDISIQESVVVKRGIDILRATSIRKNDGKYEILKHLTAIEVHTKCRQEYILKSNDEIFVKQSDASIASTSLQFRPTKTKLEKSIPDFENQCLFLRAYGLHVSDDYEKKIKHQPISSVKKPAFTDGVTNIISKRHDDMSKQVCKRIANNTDLVAVDARSHTDYCYASTMIEEKDNESSKGRPLDENVTKAMDIICSYIENHDDCQFTLQELKGLLIKYRADYVPDDETIKSKLIERYGRNIIWCTKSTSTIICFRGIEHEVLTKSWYESRLQNEEEEQLRILKAAASIIRQDIRSQICQNYFPSDNIVNIVEHVNDFIPASLDFLTKEIILKDKKGNLDNLEKQCTAINHAIMHAVRPRSFISPLLIPTS